MEMEKIICSSCDIEFEKTKEPTMAIKTRTKHNIHICPICWKDRYELEIDKPKTI